MELRKYDRFFPQFEIIVALVSDEGNVFTGPLVDLSRSGLSFNYTRRSKRRIPRNAISWVILKNGWEPLSDPLVCEVVRKTHVRARSAVERWGVKFKTPLAASAMESLPIYEKPWAKIMPHCIDECVWPDGRRLRQ